MRNLLKLAVLLALLDQTAQAIELLDIKSGSINNLTVEQVKAVWSSKTPACIKDRSQLLGVNQAFKANNLGFGDCVAQNTKRAQTVHAALGIKVVKFNLGDLPAQLIRQIKGVK